MKHLIFLLTFMFSMLFMTSINAQITTSTGKSNFKIHTQKPDRYIVYYQKGSVAKAKACKTKAEIIVFLNGYNSSVLANPNAKDINAKIKPDELLYIYDLKKKENIDFCEFTVQNKVRKKKIERKEWTLEQWKRSEPG